MNSFPDSPTYITWLLGQSVAVVILAAWVWSLIRSLRHSSRANEALQQRNSELAASLVDVVVSASRERASNNELNLKSVLDVFEQTLHAKPGESPDASRQHKP